MGYEKKALFYVFVDEGSGIDESFGISLNHCKEMCSKTLGCESFAYCSRSDGKDIPDEDGRCHLKDLEGSKKKAVKKTKDCTSYFKQHTLDKSKYKVIL